MVPYGVAKNMDTPNPDPGEEYQHVNTQLFEIIDPQASRGVLAEKMTASFNAPARDAPLSPLAVAAFHGYMALMSGLGVKVPEEEDDQPLQGREALAMVHETAGELFPRLHRSGND